MMKANGIKPAKGAHRQKSRVGRGQGSGAGCTAGKGNKGARCRRGRRTKAYFEGGQTPLTRRLPKRGFVNVFRKEFQIVNVGDLEGIDSQDQEIDAKVLFANGLIHSPDRPVKILGNGDINKPITIKADAYSQTAREKLKSANATVR
jgi:large subunit ribosomal protein L15